MPEAQAAAIPALGSPTFFRDPYRTYRALLDGGVRTVRLSSHIVAFTHYQDCLEILRDPRLSAKRYMRNLAHYTEEQRKGIGDWERLSAHMMIFMDAPDHTRVRKLLLRAFSPEALAAMLPRIEALFGEILDAAPAGVEVDFLRQVAHRFPPLVIGEILGVPHTHWRRLMEWSDAFIEFLATLQPPYELGLRANRAAVEMREYLRELSEEKRARPSDDL
ncbi:MAG TPA: hypothetical protein VGS58_16130, partial [Candidatus Sulfopaludibacter sp.]|nr:hypothetical protein [Candidatus Sulfopaludibacter sp.]